MPAIATETSLFDPITQLSGVRSNLATKLAKINVVSIQDILFHLPRRYYDKTRITPIDALQIGSYSYVQATVDFVKVVYSNRRSLLCQVSDNSGSIQLRFFYFSAAQKNNFKVGRDIRCYGQIRQGQKMLEIIHPEYLFLNHSTIQELEETLTPIYPTTDGLQQKQLFNLTNQALGLLNTQQQLHELLPEHILEKEGLSSLSTAIKHVHRPPPDADLELLTNGAHPAQQRLAFEELLAHQLSLLKLRANFRAEPSHAFPKSKHYIQQLLQQLPFELTSAQQRSFADVEQDLQQSQAMLRLIQGDVGSGKTIVAAMTALQVIEDGFKAALMVPTEILAEQHYANLSKQFKDLNIPVLLLLGRMKKSERDHVLLQLRQEEPLLIIGTHTLFQNTVKIDKLGLVIIDEQHRFGVHQRLSLLEKGTSFYPHQLIMTATPIPRTLAMSLYADLDHSIIDELPPNRQAITTSILSQQKRDEVAEHIHNICFEGRQVYWVCTLVEESENLQCEAAISTFDYLQKRLPDVNIGLVHGRLKSQEKDQVMRLFKQGDVQLLVATTVVEVGVDVPNASLMIIENAERLGLSQLHQLRGRVGRGDVKSDCLLLYSPPLSDIAKQRLEVMRTSQDGFFIAQKDLELRGAGEIFGKKQTGVPDMRVANLMRDAKLLPQVQRTAQELIKEYPDNVELLMKRWINTNVDYGNV